MPELPLVTAYSGNGYRTAVVTRDDLQLVSSVTFSFSPTAKENLRFEVLDRSYGKIFVNVGDEVHAGDLIAMLDSSAEEAAIKQTETELNRLRIHLEAARKELQIALEQEALQGNRSTVTSEARRADVNFYSASIAIQQARLEEQQAEVEGLKLFAGIDGTVTFVKSVTEETRSTKTDIVATITDLNSGVFIALTSDYALFPQGETFVVLTDEGAYGTVSKDPALFGISTEKTRNGQYNVCLEPAGGETPTGNNVRGTVTTVLDERKDVLLLPSRAVFTVGNRAYVYCEDENGLKTAKQISVGLDNGNFIEITGGLEEGDSVILG